MIQLQFKVMFTKHYGGARDIECITNRELFRQCQRTDDWCQSIIEYITNYEQFKNSIELDELKKYQVILYRELINNKFQINSESQLIEKQIISPITNQPHWVSLVPPSLVITAIEYAHWNQNNGHTGQRATRKWLQQRMWWPGMSTDIDWYVSTCHNCQIGNDGQQHNVGTLQPLIAEFARQ